MNQWRSYEFFRKREVSVSGFFLSFTLKWGKGVDNLFHNMVVDYTLFSCEVGGVQPGGHNAVCFIRTIGHTLDYAASAELFDGFRLFAPT